MDKHQKEFLLITFFEHRKFAGWRNIATKLIDEGSCIIPKHETTGNLWEAGIGNFIDVEDTDEAVGCVKLIFNVDEFISKDNHYFMEQYEYYLERVYEETKEVEINLKTIVAEYDSINNIIL